MVLYTNRSPEASRVWREFHCSMVASKHRHQEQEISAPVPSFGKQHPVFSLKRRFLNADVAHHMNKKQGKHTHVFQSGPKCSGCFSLYLSDLLGLQMICNPSHFCPAKVWGCQRLKKGYVNPKGRGPRRVMPMASPKKNPTPPTRRP